MRSVIFVIMPWMMGRDYSQNQIDLKQLIQSIKAVDIGLVVHKFAKHPCPSCIKFRHHDFACEQK